MAPRPGRKLFFKSRITAPQLFVGSFLLLILLGTVGFKTLPGLYTGEPLSWLNALFTATSAVCVTGLIVVDTATHFTQAGQAYLLLLIQLGGLGIIAFTSLIISMLGFRLSLTHESITKGSAQVAPNVDHRSLIRHVLLYTLMVEAIGMLLLYLLWMPDMGWKAALWPSVFHAISAFCNAGFSTFSDSLMGYHNHPAILLVVGVLIVVGGIGFLVMEELYLLRRAKRNHKPFRLSMHSRLVLISTAVLLVGGWTLFSMFEWSVTLDGMSFVDKLTNGLFMSITARTAGFNSVDYAHAASGTNFLTIILMSIGGSPGSTAGGMKTVTVALIVLMAFYRMRGRLKISIWGRSIPRETAQRAVSLFVVGFVIVTIGIFIFTTTEIDWVDRSNSGGFLPYMFEAVSAFNTVGLSMGVTGDLTLIGRVAAILMMFLGRVGPLMFADALARSTKTGVAKIQFATEDVALG